MSDAEEDYELEYSEDDDSQPDVDLENQYYNSKVEYLRMRATYLLITIQVFFFQVVLRLLQYHRVKFQLLSVVNVRKIC